MLDFTGEAIWLPKGQPNDAEVGISLNIDDMLVESSGAGLTSVTVANAPSGSGEMVIDSVLIVLPNVVIVRSGGQPGRTYQVNMVLGYENGMQVGVPMMLEIDPQSAITQAQQAPSEGYSTPVNGVFAPSLNYTFNSNAGMRMLGWN